jgi:hypothetical protein
MTLLEVALRIEGSFSIYGGHFHVRRVEDGRESEKKLKEEMKVQPQSFSKGKRGVNLHTVRFR